MKKTILHRIALATVLVSLATPVAACEDDDPLAPAHPDSTIVETAIAAGSFETLVAAVQAAGLVEALSAEGPFTVFAPTDAAFAALPDGTLESLLQPENRAQLEAILTYHVVAGRLTAGDVIGSDELVTLQGQRLPVVVTDGVVTVGGATVVQTDVAASNGVIHVIDSVLLPQYAENPCTKPATLGEGALAPLPPPSVREVGRATPRESEKRTIGLPFVSLRGPTLSETM
jgi:uncharacterized surface protein with fasciclin (FAS1) repeats